MLKDCSRYSANTIENLICFFALDTRQQINLIPSLNIETKFDFHDGDLVTDKALLVLANQYMDIRRHY